MKVIRFALTMLVLAAVALPAMAAKRASVHIRTRNFGPYSSTGTRFSYSHTGSRNRWSINSRLVGKGFDHTWTNTYPRAPSGGYYGYYPANRVHYSNGVLYTSSITGRVYPFCFPWSYGYRPVPRTMFSRIDENPDSVIISTGVNRGFMRSFARRQPDGLNLRFRGNRVVAPRTKDISVDAGDEFFALGHYAEAAEVFEKVVAESPNDGLAHFAVAHARYATGDYSEAAAAIRKGIKLLPRWGEVPMDRRSFYSDQKDFDIQMWALNVHLKQAPDDDDARLVLAYNLYFTRHRKEAKAEFEKLLEANPKDAAAAYFMKYLE